MRQRSAASTTFCRGRASLSVGRGGRRPGGSGRWPAGPAGICGCGTWGLSSTCTAGTSDSAGWRPTAVSTRAFGAGDRIATARPASWHCWRRAIAVVPAERLWVNPDCGLRTRDYPEVEASLVYLVAAAAQVRAG
ncbi:hypothetical protein [Phytohabitans suffuscus]|uniref:hypothetical protein n=1 Tax=Phytohabitans suffuscus TaxID=624315 RepID=UPI0015638152|nr:hypothetical protein [Phytohabitans suffuscus]